MIIGSLTLPGVQITNESNNYIAVERGRENAMELRNGCSSPGCRRGAQDDTVINQIMLRFRPIAPKPADTSGSASGSGPSEDKTELPSRRRSKRKQFTVRKNRKSAAVKKVEGEDSKNVGGGSGVALQLLPEDSVLEYGSVHKNVGVSIQEPSVRMMNSCTQDNLDNFTSGAAEQLDRRSAAPSVKVVESWVMVDDASDTWIDQGELGITDEEKVKNLEADTCPALISDGTNRVQWVNRAYRRMVNPQSDEAAAEVVVWLVVKNSVWLSREKRPSAFACTVRVVSGWGKEKHTQTMPCDVWRMDFGGFAWRLDAKAALSLGR